MFTLLVLGWGFGLTLAYITFVKRKITIFNCKVLKNDKYLKINLKKQENFLAITIISNKVSWWNLFYVNY